MGSAPVLSRTMLLALCVALGCSSDPASSSGERPPPPESPAGAAADGSTPAEPAPAEGGLDEAPPAEASPAEAAESPTTAADGTGETGETGETGDTGETSDTGALNPDLRLADLGAAVFEALRDANTDAIVDLTPLGDGAIATLCTDAATQVESKLEIEARARHCIKSIPWARVSDVRVSGAQPSGVADGCLDGVQSFDRFRMLVVTDTKNWEIDLLGSFGRDGTPEGFSGAIACKPR